MTESSPSPTPRDRMIAMGDTIRFFRHRAGPGGSKLSVTALAERLGQTRQSVEAYEAGRTAVVLRDDKQAEIAEGLTIPPQVLRREYERRLTGNTLPDGAAEQGRSFDPFPEVSAPRLLMPDDHLRPWATSATTILYDPAQPPREGEGVVIKAEDGQLHVKIFVRADADQFHVRELVPPRDLVFDRAGARAYRVIGRLG